MRNSHLDFYSKKEEVLNECLTLCSKKREAVPDLAPMLWHSFGTVAALLQEIVNIYPAIHPPHLTVKYETVLIVISTSPTQCVWYIMLKELDPGVM